MKRRREGETERERERERAIKLAPFRELGFRRFCGETCAAYPSGWLPAWRRPLGT